MNKVIKILTTTLLAAAMLTPVTAMSQSRPGDIDIFMGAQLSYRDIFFNGRVYDVLVNLTPGVKWNMGRGWEAGAQALVPIINQYGPRYSKVRLNVAEVSKQFGFFDRWRMKVSGGWFSYERYGIDIKNMVAVNDWLAVTAQFGLTGYCSMADGWEASDPGRWVAVAGPEVYLDRWNTQMSVRAGRFLFDDYGVVGEVMRHFKHTTVSVYGSYSSLWKENAGFKVIVMLPPYTTKRRKVNFRPASNFRLTYQVETKGSPNYIYRTDPEENERQGWFDHNIIPWGPDAAFRDFERVEQSDSTKTVRKL